MFNHNPSGDRWGNSMEAINGVAAGALNGFQSISEALGVGDLIDGVGYAADKATLYAISPLSADGKLSAIGGLGGVAGFERDTREAVERWLAENPNAAETMEAGFNLAAAAKAAKLAKSAKAGKAGVSRDFSEAYKDGAPRPSWRDSEIDVGKHYPDYGFQKSFMDGKEVPYGTKGSVRPEYYTSGHSVEVKNYNIETASGRSSLVNNVSKQIKQRAIHLPEGTKQTIIIDLRGQDVNNNVLKNIRTKIIEKSGYNVEIMFKTK